LIYEEVPIDGAYTAVFGKCPIVPGCMKAVCFKAYDIRGRVPDELNADLACRIAYAYAKVTGAGCVVVGHDIRLTSPEIADAVMQGLRLAGVKVFDIGLCGTENVYFTTINQKVDGGIMVTASHNPEDYNGMKMVHRNSRPIGTDSGLQAIREMVEDESWDLPDRLMAERQPADDWDDYIQHLLSYIHVDELMPLKVVVNPGNGGAGLVINRLAKHLPFEFIQMDFEADGHFPHGVPNPLLPENQARTADKVREAGADLGIAWDGDFDRCFLFDENGNFINGYYLVGLIAAELLSLNPGERVVHDPRLMWNTIQTVREAGGEPVLSKTGHSYIKAIMREEDAIYGGEISGHHYFREFGYCDSGMIPWLLVTALMCRVQQPLSWLVSDYQSRFPASDEINQRVDDAEALIKKVQAHYRDQAEAIDHVDGLSMAFADWRFNLRMSNTEPLLRLNVETRTDKQDLDRRILEVMGLLQARY